MDRFTAIINGIDKSEAHGGRSLLTERIRSEFSDQELSILRKSVNRYFESESESDYGHRLDVTVRFRVLLMKHLTNELGLRRRPKTNEEKYFWSLHLYTGPRIESETHLQGNQLSRVKLSRDILLKYQSGRYVGP